MNKLRKLSFDLGNYTTIGLDEMWFEGRVKKNSIEGHYVKFESRFREIDEKDIDEFDSSLKICYKNKYYRYEDGVFEVENDKYDRDNILLCFVSALARLCNDGETVSVGVGVPIKQHRENKDKIINMILSNSPYEVEVFTSSFRKAKKTIEVKEVTVVPEAIGAYFSLDEEVLDERGNSDLIMFDIGSKTFDMCTIDKNNNITKSKTEQRGSFDYYEKLMSHINNDYPTANVTLEEVQEVIENGLYLRNNKIDFSESVERFLKQEAKDICNIISQYDKKFNRHYLVISGGHGETLFPALKKEIEHANLHSDPINANASGIMAYMKEKEVANG